MLDVWCWLAGVYNAQHNEAIGSKFDSERLLRISAAVGLRCRHTLYTTHVHWLRTLVASNSQLLCHSAASVCVCVCVVVCLPSAASFRLHGNCARAGGTCLCGRCLCEVLASNLAVGGVSADEPAWFTARRRCVDLNLLHAARNAYLVTFRVLMHYVLVTEYY